MKKLVSCVLFFGLIVLTLQDISRRKGCDCSICNTGGNRLNPIVNRKHEERGKSSCSICERRKEMLRMERERQKQFQKCPFEILGAPAIRGKTSEEIFDEFRELIVPSQNSFFDMMRGIVRTVHVSTEAELKEAKEKEARELAEERRGVRRKTPREEENPKITVVLKQTPCGQVLKQNQEIEAVTVPLIKRLPKEIRDAFPFLDEEENPTTPHPQTPVLNAPLEHYPNFEDENEQIIQHLFNGRMMTSERPPPIEDDRPEINEVETMTEFPLVKFMSDEEFKAQAGRSVDEFRDLGLAPLNLPYFSNDWGLVDKLIPSTNTY